MHSTHSYSHFSNDQWLPRLLIVFVWAVVLAIFPLTPNPTDVKILLTALAALVASVMLACAPSSSRPLRSTLLLPLLTAYGALNLASSLTSANPGYSLSHEFSKLAALLILFAASSRAFSKPERVRPLFLNVCIAAAVASLYGFLQYGGLDPAPWADKGGMLRTAPATFGNPNYASHTLVLAVIFCCGLFAMGKRLVPGLCICIFVAHFTLTKTRGSILALAAAFVLVVVALLIFRKIKNPAAAAAAVLLSLLAIGAVGLLAVGSVSYKKTGQPWPSDGNLTLRMHSIDEACRMIQAKPVLGHGPGMYQVVSPRYWNQLEKERFGARGLYNAHVHNEPLEIAADCGLPAAILFMSILILGVYYGLAMWASSQQNDRRVIGLTLAAFFFAFLVDGFFGFNAHVPVSSVLLFVMLGVTHALYSQAPEPEGESNLAPRRLPARLALVFCAAVLCVGATLQFAAQLFHQRGKGATEYKAHAAAADAYAKAGMLDPFDWDHPYFEGAALQADMRPEESLAKFQRALTLNPNMIYAWVELAKTTLDVSNSPEGAYNALQYAKRASEINPEVADVQDILARAYLTQAQEQAGNAQDPTEAALLAQDHFQKAIELGSKQKWKLHQLSALASLTANDPRTAFQALAKAVLDAPDQIALWQMFLQVSDKAGQHETLMASIERALPLLARAEDSTAYASVAVMRAKILFNVYNDAAAAEKQFADALKTCPGSDDAWAAYFQFARQTETLPRFLETFQNLAQNKRVKPDSFQPLIKAAHAAAVDGKSGVLAAIDQVGAALNQMQAQSKSVNELQTSLNWIAYLIEYSAGKAEFDGDNAGKAFLNLALMHCAIQQFEQALPLFDSALPSLTGKLKTSCLLKKGEALLKLSRYKEALEAVKLAAESAPADFDARFALAQAYARDGQKDRARFEYSTILQTFSLNEKGMRTIQERLNELAQ